MLADQYGFGNRIAFTNVGRKREPEPALAPRKSECSGASLREELIIVARRAELVRAWGIEGLGIEACNAGSPLPNALEVFPLAPPDTGDHLAIFTSRGFSGVGLRYFAAMLRAWRIRSGRSMRRSTTRSQRA